MAGREIWHDGWLITWSKARGVWAGGHGWRAGGQRSGQAEQAKSDLNNTTDLRPRKASVGAGIARKPLLKIVDPN